MQRTAVVGVMCNLSGESPEEGEPPDSGAELDSESTVLPVAYALGTYGHEVVFIEDNETAYFRLFNRNVDIVFNMCEGLRGESRESHIPAMLEMLGALKTYQVLECRDFARVDMRLYRKGIPNVIEVNPLPGMAPGYSDYPRIAEKAGWSYDELVNACALKRYGLLHLVSPRLLADRQIA